MMARSKFKHRRQHQFFQSARWLVPRLVQAGVGLCLLSLSACRLPASLKLPESIPLPDLLNWPLEQIRPSSSAPAPIPVAPLKLGTLFSLTGSLDRYGSTMQDTTRLLVETVNGCGGVLNQSVQLLAEDDASNVETGKQAATRLTESSRLGAMIGAIGSEVSNATINIAVKNQVVQISPASASPVLTERAKQGSFQGFWFRTMLSDAHQGEALARLAQQRNFQKVAILALDTDYGSSIVQTFEATFKQLGGTLTTSSRFSPYASPLDIDYARTFGGFGEAPDAVLLVAAPELGGAILRTAYDRGFLNGKIKILLPASMKTNALAQQLGQAIDGRYIASSVVGIAPMTGSPAFNQFRETYKTHFGREPNLYDPNTWDAAAIAVLAAEAAKDSSGTMLKKKITAVANPPGIEVSDVCQALSFVQDGKEINYQGVSGAVDFNALGDSIANYDVWTIDYSGNIKVESSIQAGEKIQAGETKDN